LSSVGFSWPGYLFFSQLLGWVERFRIDQLGFKSVYLRGDFLKYETAVLPLWSHIVQNSWFLLCIAALLSSWILLFIVLAVDKVSKINVLFPLTKVFHHNTEVFCLIAFQPTIFSLLSFACQALPRNFLVHYPDKSGITLLIVCWIIPQILRGASVSWFINVGVSTVFTVFRSIWFRRIWFYYPLLFLIAQI
jgi:hypothetical protein